MTEKEKRLQALLNLKKLHEIMLMNLELTNQDQSAIDEILDALSNVMKEIQKLENDNS